MGRIASGVRAIKLDKEDEVVSMELVEPEQQLMVVTENGFGKRTPVEEYKIQVRGGKGLLTYDKAKFSKTGRLSSRLFFPMVLTIFLATASGSSRKRSTDFR